MQVPLQDEETVLKIVKRGEERARYGQRTVKAAMTPFRITYELRPKHPMSRQVAELIPRLEEQKFHNMGDVDEWRRLDEIRRIALSQIKDESNKLIYQQMRVGGERVLVEDSVFQQEDATDLFPARTKTQLALSEGMEYFIPQLTEQQQFTIRLRYWDNLSIKDTATARHVMKETVRDSEDKAKRSLLRMWSEAFPKDGELLEVAS